MKKYLFFLSILSMLLLTACSSEDDIAAVPEMTQEERDAIIAEAGQNSDVPIRLGMGSLSASTIVTRAPLEPLPTESNGLFETPAGKYLGIYCLAQKPQVPVSSVGPVAENNINWSTGKSQLHYLLEHNQAGKVVLVGAGSTIGDMTLSEKTSVVLLLDQNTLNSNTPTIAPVAYYPFSSWYNYHFYAYYPRQAEGNNVTENKVTVDYTLDGTQDVIWAKATPPSGDEDTGFNAKYIRTHQNSLPQLVLNHKLTQLRFFVKCSSSTYDTYEYDTEIGNAAPYKKLFQIQDVTLKDIPNGWTMTIADRETPANEGKLVRKGTTVADIPIKKMAFDGSGAVDPNNTDDSNAFDGTSATRVPIPYIPNNSSDDPTMLGYALIPTTAMMSGDVPYFTFSIYYGETKDNTTSAVIPGTTYTSEKLALTVPTGGFLEGKVYNVVLNIPPPEEIHMHATLDVWEVVPQSINMTIE